MVKILTTDNIILELDNKYVHQSRLLNDIITYSELKEPLELKITSEILVHVINFMSQNTIKLSRDYDPLEIRFREADYCFISKIENDKLVDLCSAANYLDFPVLLELCCKVIAWKMKNKNLEAIKELTNVESDMNEQERKRIDDEFDWVASSYDNDV